MFLYRQPLSCRSDRSSRDRVSDGDRIINPVKEQHVFSLRWQTSLENNIKVRENFCGTTEPRGFLSLHKGLGWVTELVVVGVKVWKHYQRRPVNSSRHQSTPASLEMVMLFKFLKRKAVRAEQRSSRGLRSWLFSLETQSESVWSLKHALVSVKLCESVPASWADFSTDVCQNTRTQCHPVHSVTFTKEKQEKENKQKPLYRDEQHSQFSLNTATLINIIKCYIT